MSVDMRKDNMDILEKIVAVLESSEADDFEVEEIRETGWEFYFIRHRLDQNRAKEVTSIKVTVYKKLEDGKFLGRATGVIAPTETETGISEVINNLVYQATLVKNPYYDLVTPEENDAVRSAANSIEGEARGEVVLKAVSEDFIKAFREVKETEASDINSYEIFVSEKKKRFINSKGVNVSMTYPTSLLEVVTNSRDENKEIELYRLYNRGTCDKESLVMDIEELLKFGKDRLVAANTPAIKTAPLILSTQDAVEIYSFIMSRASSANKYMGVTSYEVGDSIAEDIKGDKPTIKAVSVLDNSSTNFVYDQEGAYVKDRYLIKDGVVSDFYGPRQFCSYLGIKESSMVYNYIVSGGNKSMEELRKGPYLEVVEFSGFGCDPFTGDIAGEIRLGYWHDGEKITPVTGGSVTGSMMDFMKDMHMSKEQRQFDNALIPAVTRLENAIITGIE